MNNYFRAQDTTRCWKACPLDDYESFEKDDFTDRTCATPCADNEFRFFDDKECYPCSEEIENCDQCTYGIEDDYVMCTACAGDYLPSYWGEMCTLCLPGQIETETGDCVYCSDLSHNCGRCDTWEGEFFCTECLGNSMFTDEGDCACNYVEYVNVQDFSDRDDAQCKLCNKEIDHCNMCESQIVDLRTFVETESFVELSEKQQIMINKILANSISEEYWQSITHCTVCEDPFFVDQYGQCVLESC